MIIYMYKDILGGFVSKGNYSLVHSPHKHTLHRELVRATLLESS